MSNNFIDEWLQHVNENELEKNTYNKILYHKKKLSIFLKFFITLCANEGVYYFMHHMSLRCYAAIIIFLLVIVCMQKYNFAGDLFKKTLNTFKITVKY